MEFIKFKMNRDILLNRVPAGDELQLVVGEGDALQLRLVAEQRVGERHQLVVARVQLKHPAHGNSVMP